MTHIHFISVNLIKIVHVGIYRPPWLIWDISKYNYYNDNYNGTYTLLPQYHFLLFFLFFHSICSIIWKIKFGWAADNKLFFLSRYIITKCVNGLWYSMACVGHTYNQNNIMTICLKFVKSGPFVFIHLSIWNGCLLQITAAIELLFWKDSDLCFLNGIYRWKHGQNVPKPVRMYWTWTPLHLVMSIWYHRLLDHNLDNHSFPK